jgi:hypothetical protein
MASDPPQPPRSGVAEKRVLDKRVPDKRVHVFDLDDLIVHNYSERDTLLKKADKLARSIINDELREGEGMRSPKPGHYLFFFPKLTPEAGALRSSVLAAQISREVRKINPTIVAMDSRLHEGAPAAPPHLHDLRQTPGRRVDRTGDA